MTAIALCLPSAGMAGSGGVSGGVSGAEGGVLGCAHYGGHASMEGRAGSRSIAEGAVFMPLACSPDLLVFGDVRYKTDTDSTHEANVALGVRALREGGVAGGYASFDRRRSGLTGKLHSQATLGAEWLAAGWEARANAYVPITGEKTVSTGPAAGSALSDPFLAGSGIFVNRAGSRVLRETPLYGADVEAGFAIPNTDLWLHMAGYRFDAPDADAMTGGRARISWNATDTITLFAEGQDDTVRPRQGWLGARLTVPFGRPAHKPEGLKARMTAPPVRDIDIVTAGNVEQVTPDRVAAALNADTQAAQRVLYVDNTAAGGGDGTVENPFNTLAAAQGQLRDHDTLYIARGDGTASGMNAGLTVTQKGVDIIGAGSAFTYGGAVLKPAGLAPVLTNAAGSGITITGDQATVTGLTVTGAASHGIFANAAAGASLLSVSVDNVTLSNNAGTGLRVEASGAGSAWNAVSANNVSATGNTLHGVLAYSRNNAQIENVNLFDITASANTNRGVFAYAETGGTIHDILLSDITSGNNSGLSGVGVQVFATGAGSGIRNVTGERIVAANNATQGLYVTAADGAQIGQSLFQDVTVENNTSHGISFRAGTSGRVDTFTLSHSVARGNGDRGVYVLADGDGDIGTVELATITSSNSIGINGTGVQILATGAGSTIGRASGTGITAGNNSVSGMYVTSTASGQIGVSEFSDITAHNNTSFGVQFFAGTAGQLNSIDFSDSVASGNGNRGIYVLAQNDGDINSLRLSNLTANNNSGGSSSGFQIYASGAGATISQVSGNNLTAVNNNVYGLLAVADTDGLINTVNLSNVTTLSNASRGVYVLSQTGGDINTFTLSDSLSAYNTGPNGAGVQAFSTGAGSTIGTLSLIDSSLINNSSYGILAYADTSGQIGTVNVSGTTSKGNANIGIILQALTSAQINAINLTDSEASSNVSRGIYITAQSDGDIQAINLADIQSNNNNVSGSNIGTQIYATGVGSTIGLLTGDGILSSGNGTYGLYINADTSGALRAKIQNAQLFSNGTHGIFINDDTAGLFTADLGGGALGSAGLNSIYGNTGADINVDLDGGQLKAENNWWGGSTGLDIAEATLDPGSTIDANPFLTSAP